MDSPFLEFHCASWAFRRLQRKPIAWLLAAVAATAWLAIQTLLPFAWSAPGGAGTRLAYEIAFLGGLAGSVLGLDAVGEADWILAQAPALRRQRARWAVIGTAGLLGAAAALALPLALGWAGDARSAVGLLLGVALLAAQGAALAAVPASRAARSLALPLLAWLLPRALAGESWPAALLMTWLDASSTIDPHASSGWAPCLAALGPIVMWAGLPLVLAPTAPPPTPLPDALRHSR